MSHPLHPPTAQGRATGDDVDGQTVGLGLNCGRRTWYGATYLYANQLAAVDELVAALDAGSDTLVSPGTDARWTVEILLGILASQQNGHNRVDLPLPRNGS